MANRDFQICTNCIMDTSDPDITFDSDGVCNHCKDYKNNLTSRTIPNSEKEKALNKVVSQIKQSGKGKDYDCIIGVSGGVDSTYIAYLTKKLGLRPLAIHFDNGWNSELAVMNIEKTLKKLDIDLYTNVVDWESFRDLQWSFLRASTPDSEIPTDHCINATLWKMANKLGIKYIIHGMNYETESSSVPAWSYGHSDAKYISSVHKIISGKNMKNIPFFTYFDLFYWTFIKGIKVVSLLNYVSYNKKEAMSILQDELDWVYYGGKHYESVYTRFFQGYILPKKFNIDKRKTHLSSLILSGQSSRSEALEEMKLPPLSVEIEKQDKEFVCKKFQISQSEFEEVMSLPIKSYKNYPNSFNTIFKIKKIVNYLRLKGLYSK